MADTIGARLKRWREQIDEEDRRALAAGEPCGNYGEEFDELLAYAERMRSVLVEYGRVERLIRDGTGVTTRQRLSAKHAVESLALELAEEED